MAIYLGRRLLNASSNLPGSKDGSDKPVFAEAKFSLLGLAPGGVYQANQVTLVAGELLPHRFTLTCATSGTEFDRIEQNPSHERPSAVYSLLHFPWSCDRSALPTTLSYGARTFLSPTA
jgi:hypothetical protein